MEEHPWNGDPASLVATDGFRSGYDGRAHEGRRFRWEHKITAARVGRHDFIEPLFAELEHRSALVADEKTRRIVATVPLHAR